MTRTLNLYRCGPAGLSFWPDAAGAEPVFRAFVGGTLVRYDDRTGRVLIRWRRRGLVALSPLAYVRLVRAGAPGFRPWEDCLPADLGAFEPPARTRRRPRGPWAIFLIPQTVGAAMRCVSFRKQGIGLTTFSDRYAKRFDRRAEALAWLDAEVTVRWPGYRYLIERL